MREQEYKHPANSGLFMPMDESNLNPEPDMTKLGDLHEAALLHNLRLRFMNDDIFTYIGPILVASNPYKRIPIFTPEFVSMYFSKSAGQVLEPHVYELANSTYVNMMRDGEDQSVVISGESGAGKTEETKLCLQFIAEVAKDPTVAEGKKGPEQLLLMSSPILEAMGNAKTVRNNNSSRFGKYMQISFNQKGKIIGGHTIKYLLEKSRVIKPGTGERNYHVFYQIFCLPAEEKKQLKLGSPDDFTYCNAGGCTDVPGINDESEFKDFRESWEILAVPTEEVQSIYNIIAGILHIGNVEFDADDEGNSSVSNDEALENAGELLKADAELLETTLTFRNMQSGGRSIVVIPNTVANAVETQQGLSKAAYSRTFDWVVDRCNLSVECTEKIRNSIGVLDIFGFEIFESNSFEQLCINLANEQLQAHFNDHIFKLELKVYQAEGLNCDGITFADNQPCLDMLIKKPQGVFPMIDEECVVPKGTDLTLLQKLQDTHRKNPFWGKPPKGTKTTFVVNHYAGGVSYCVDDFLDKNRDSLQPDIQAYMAESGDTFIQNMFPAPKASRGRAPTLGGQFRTSLQELYDKLNSTAPHFIKCLKTNEVKQPGNFDGEYCLRQITYLGLLEVVNIRRQGFPVRRHPDKFVTRYKVLDENAKPEPKALLTSVGLEGKWQIGKTMVFMKDEQFMALETLRGLRLEKSVVILQRFLKAEQAGKKWKKSRVGYMLIGPICRGGHARALVEKMKLVKQNIDNLNSAIAACEPRFPPTPDTAAFNKAIASAEESVSLSFAGKPMDGVEEIKALLTKAKALEKRIREEETVFTQLEAALKAEDEDDCNDALASAKELKPPFENDIIKQIEAFLNGEAEARKAAASAASKEDVEKMLKEALAVEIGETVESLKEARKSLNGAVARAKESQVKNEDVDACKAKAEEVGKTLNALASLEDAIKKKIKEDIESAIADAKENGVAASKIKEGETVLTELSLKAELNSLSKEQNAAETDEQKEAVNKKIDEILARGEEAGVKLERPVKGLSAAAKASRAGKADLYVLLQEQTYGARLAQMVDVFALEKFEALRPVEGDMKSTLVFRKKDIERPLTIYTCDDNERVIELERKACAAFSSMLGYMGEKYHQYPELLASQILQDGIENEELRDEIYLQCMCQCTLNPDLKSAKRAWQLMSLLVKVFPPTLPFRPYVEVFFYHATTAQGKKGKKGKMSVEDEIIRIAQTSLRKLDIRVKEGALDAAPSEEEIQALRAEQPIMLKIYFTDHSFKNFQVDEDLLVSDLLNTISATLKVVLIDTYALYDVSNGGGNNNAVVLDPQLKVMQVMQDWNKKVKLNNKPFAKKGIAKHNMVFSKRLYVDKIGEVPQDPVELHLLYTQAKGCVLRGKYAVTDTEALLLAALTLQIEYGNHNPEKHTAGFLRNELIKYIPKHLYGLQKPEVWEKDFVSTHMKMKGFTEMMSKQAYVKSSQKFRGYGFTFFQAKQSHLAKKEAKTIFLGVNVDGVAIFKTSDKSLYETYRFAKLKSWAASATQVTFKVSKDDKNHKLTQEAVSFLLDEGEDVCKLLKDYALWLAAKRKREKKEKKRKADAAAKAEEEK